MKGWELSITYKDNTHQSFSHPEFRDLWQVYCWFIARKDSPLYDVTYGDGRMVILRDQVKRMKLDNKQIVDIWSKEKEAA